jgi:hypothetical protein
MHIYTKKKIIKSCYKDQPFFLYFFRQHLELLFGFQSLTGSNKKNFVALFTLQCWKKIIREHTCNTEFKTSVTFHSFQFQKYIFKVLTLSCAGYFHVIKFTPSPPPKKKSTPSSFRCVTIHNPDSPQASNTTDRNSGNCIRIVKALTVPRIPAFVFFSDYGL